MTERGFLEASGERIPYELERKAVKRMNLRVRRDGSVHVSVPARMPRATVERLLNERAAWVRDARARMLARHGEVLEATAGTTVPLEGVPYAVTVVPSGREYAVRQSGTLILHVKDPADPAARGRVLRRFIKEEATRVLTEAARAIYPLFAPHPATFPSITVRKMTSRWGSCTAAKNHITLNERLLFVEPWLARYVILHEFCHFKHPNHSAKFYRHLASFCPQYAAARRALKAAVIPEYE